LGPGREPSHWLCRRQEIRHRHNAVAVKSGVVRQILIAHVLDEFAGPQNIRRGIEMKYSEDQLRAFINTIPTPAWSSALDGCADFFNQAWLVYTGLSADQSLEWGWKGAIHPDDLTCILRAFEEAVNSERPFEVQGRFRRKDGEFRWFLVRGSPLRDGSGKVVRWCGTNTDNSR